MFHIIAEQGMSFQVASDELASFLAQLRQSKIQSLNISVTVSGWPLVSVLRNGDWVAIHYTAAKGSSMFLLKNGAAAEAPESLEFTFEGGKTPYPQDSINPLDRLGDVLRTFETQHLLVMDDQWFEL